MPQLRAHMSRSPPHIPGHTTAPSPGQTTENGLEEEEEEEEEGDLDDEADASRLEKFMRDRRRARSLPAYPAALLGCGPGSAERKRVKFADSMGLNLASVKHFSALEEPQIPNKVLSRYRRQPPQQQQQQQDLLGDLYQDPGCLVTCFPEPRDPERRVQQLRVCLEKICIGRFDIRGQIRILNRGARTEVGVRYTLNDWLSYVDAQALSASAEEQPGSVGERFCFTVFTPPFMDSNSALHFALYMRSEDGEFWDNNDGHNYTLRYRCMRSSATFVGAAFHDI